MKKSVSGASTLKEPKYIAIERYGGDTSYGPCTLEEMGDHLRADDPEAYVFYLVTKKFYGEMAGLKLLEETDV